MNHQIVFFIDSGNVSNHVDVLYNCYRFIIHRYSVYLMTNHSKDNKQNIAICPVCLEKINVGATKCIHCGSFQDFRRYMNISSSFLALIVALISVSSFFIPLMIETFEDKDSDIGISLQFIRHDGIFLVASNSGTRTGNVGLGKFFIEGENKEGFLLTVADRTSGNSFIHGNESKFVILYKHAKEVRKIDFLPKDINSRKCTVKIEIINFSGEKKYIDKSRQCEEFIEYIKNNFLIYNNKH